MVRNLVLHLPTSLCLLNVSHVFRIFLHICRPNLSQLPDYIQFKVFPGTPLNHIFTAASNDLLMLIEKLLAMYPHNRCTATEALKMEYFLNKPAPTVGHRLPMPNTNVGNNNDDLDEFKPSLNLKRKLESLAEGVSVPKKRLQF